MITLYLNSKIYNYLNEHLFCTSAYNLISLPSILMKKTKNKKNLKNTGGELFHVSAILFKLDLHCGLTYECLRHVSCLCRLKCYYVSMQTHYMPLLPMTKQ